MANRSWLLIPLCLLIAGCATTKRVSSLEQRVSVLENKTAPAEREQTPTETQVTTPSAPQEKALPETPTKKEIQEALKKAGYYKGEVDGKIGHKTKMAIEEFQKANGLKADGKVGPQTWDKLKEYLR